LTNKWDDGWRKTDARSGAMRRGPSLRSNKSASGYLSPSTHMPKASVSSVDGATKTPAAVEVSVGMSWRWDEETSWEDEKTVDVGDNPIELCTAALS
jgi:hypothetical protein